MIGISTVQTSHGARNVRNWATLRISHICSIYLFSAAPAVHSLGPPHGLDELVAPGQAAVERVPAVGGLVVVLVVLLRGVERGRVDDDSLDGRREPPRRAGCRSTPGGRHQIGYMDRIGCELYRVRSSLLTLS
jgi:hypothetical protein